MLVGIAEKVFKVRGQRSRLQRDQIHWCGGGLHFDGIASRLTHFFISIVLLLFATNKDSYILQDLFILKK